MQQFTRGDIDCYSCTSIIESGLDIPNANTLIVDRADTFGLAQLYQLRGPRRAAARSAPMPTSSATAASLRHAGGQPAVGTHCREHPSWGRAFRRHARPGDARGRRPARARASHGHIAAVGFHLYTRLLSKSVSDLKRAGKLAPGAGAAQISLYHPIINVDLPLEVGIPSEYVVDKAMRLKLYRRLADIHDLSEIDALKEEFADRFGKLPEEVENLLYQLKVRVLAESAGVISISEENRQLALRFPSKGPNEPPRRFPNLGMGVRTSKNTVWLSNPEGGAWRDRLDDVLKRLAESPEISKRDNLRERIWG